MTRREAAAYAASFGMVGMLVTLQVTLAAELAGKTEASAAAFHTPAHGGAPGQRPPGAWLPQAHDVALDVRDDAPVTRPLAEPTCAEPGPVAVGGVCSPQLRFGDARADLTAALLVVHASSTASERAGLQGETHSPPSAAGD